MWPFLGQSTKLGAEKRAIFSVDRISNSLQDTKGIALQRLGDAPNSDLTRPEATVKGGERSQRLHCPCTLPAA